MKTYKLILSTLSLFALVWLAYMEKQVDWYVYTTLIGVIFGAGIEDVKEVLRYKFGDKWNR